MKYAVSDLHTSAFCRMKRTNRFSSFSYTRLNYMQFAQTKIKIKKNFKLLIKDEDFVTAL